MKQPHLHTLGLGPVYILNLTDTGTQHYLLPVLYPLSAVRYTMVKSFNHQIILNESKHQLVPGGCCCYPHFYK